VKRNSRNQLTNMSQEPIVRKGNKQLTKRIIEGSKKSPKISNRDAKSFLFEEQDQSSQSILLPNGPSLLENT
jgi:hypothetical protein